MINNEDLPIGFTMELAQHSDALIRFSNMSKEHQDSIISGAKQINSRQEMRSYVENLTRQEGKPNEKNKFF